MVHPKGTTPLQFDKKCAHGILTGVIKQKQYKGVDMKLHWLRDISIEKKQLHTHYKCGKHNIGGYTKKHRPDKHHRTICHLYVANATTKFNESFATAINQLPSFCKVVLNTNNQRKRLLQNI